jgi:hypothetical protein
MVFLYGRAGRLTAKTGGFPARADTHLTVEPAHNNWLSFGPAVDKYSADEFVDAYPYGVRLQIESNGHYGAFASGLRRPGGQGCF